MKREWILRVLESIQRAWLFPKISLAGLLTFTDLLSIKIIQWQSGEMDE